MAHQDSTYSSCSSKLLTLSCALGSLMSCMVAYSHAFSVAAGDRYSCARSSTNEIVCWGSSGFNATYSSSHFLSISAGPHACGVLVSSRVVRCWSRTMRPDLTSLPTNEITTPCSEVSVGKDYHSCALRLADLTPFCWGTVDSTYSGASVPPEPQTAYSSISAGFDHTCAIRVATQRAHCWGNCNGGVCNAPNIPLSHIAAGRRFTCAIHADTSAPVCWGTPEASLVPPTDLAQPAGGTGARLTSISAGLYHVCAVRADRLGVCWGSVVESPAAIVVELPPSALLANIGYLEISAGVYHSCGLRSDGYVSCWGDNQHNQLEVPAPFAVPTPRPSQAPSSPFPSLQPSRAPSNIPTSYPSQKPTGAPSDMPSASPTKKPTVVPTSPTGFPSQSPSISPSGEPSGVPSWSPSRTPSRLPTSAPTSKPTKVPSSLPTLSPTATPTALPSQGPSFSPSLLPSLAPTPCSAVPNNVIDLLSPSACVGHLEAGRCNDTAILEICAYTCTGCSAAPTSLPTTAPSFTPSITPTTCNSIRSDPQYADIDSADDCAVVLNRGLCEGSALSLALRPRCLWTCSGCTDEPSASPTSIPSKMPSQNPTTEPSTSPSLYPSTQPSAVPVDSPSRLPSKHPSTSPSPSPSANPSKSPSIVPTSYPSYAPASARPTADPITVGPTSQPTSIPTKSPTASRCSSVFDSDRFFCDFMISRVHLWFQATPQNSSCFGCHCRADQIRCRASCDPHCHGDNESPTRAPTMSPIVPTAPQPSHAPTTGPSVFPTKSTTSAPSSQNPTFSPSSGSPSATPTAVPSASPLTSRPTLHPVTSAPTMHPSVHPSRWPTTSLPTSEFSDGLTLYFSLTGLDSTVPTFELEFTNGLLNSNGELSQRSRDIFDVTRHAASVSLRVASNGLLLVGIAFNQTSLITVPMASAVAGRIQIRPVTVQTTSFGNFRSISAIPRLRTVSPTVAPTSAPATSIPTREPTVIPLLEIRVYFQREIASILDSTGIVALSGGVQDRVLQILNSILDADFIGRPDDRPIATLANETTRVYVESEIADAVVVGMIFVPAGTISAGYIESVVDSIKQTPVIVNIPVGGASFPVISFDAVAIRVTRGPTISPTVSPTESVSPSNIPTNTPSSSSPTSSPVSSTPSTEPTVSASPSGAPSTPSPTDIPSSTAPTTASPTAFPTVLPSSIPTTPSPTGVPSTPTPTLHPSGAPSLSPTTISPSSAPSNHPSRYPSSVPTTSTPSYSPSFEPTTVPSSTPTSTPSRIPSSIPSSIPSRTPTVPAVFFQAENCGANRTNCTLLVGSDPDMIRCRNFPRGSDVGQCWCHPDRYQCSSGNLDFACYEPRAVCIQRSTSAPSSLFTGNLSDFNLLIEFGGDFSLLETSSVSAFQNQIFDAIDVRARQIFPSVFDPRGISPSFVMVKMHDHGSIQGIVTFKKGSLWTRQMVLILANDLESNPINIVESSTSSRYQSSLVELFTGVTDQYTTQTRSTKSPSWHPSSQPSAQPSVHLFDSSATSSEDSNNGVIFTFIVLAIILVLAVVVKFIYDKRRDRQQVSFVEDRNRSSAIFNQTYSSSATQPPHSMISNGTMISQPYSEQYATVTPIGNQASRPVEVSHVNHMNPIFNLQTPSGMHFASPGPEWISRHHGDTSIVGPIESMNSMGQGENGPSSPLQSSLAKHSTISRTFGHPVSPIKGPTEDEFPGFA